MSFSSRGDHTLERKSLILYSVFITILLLDRERRPLLAHRLARLVCLGKIGCLNLRVEHQVGRRIDLVAFVFQLGPASRLAI